MLKSILLAAILLIPGCLVSDTDEAAPIQSSALRGPDMTDYDPLLGAVVTGVRVMPDGQVALLMLQKNGVETLVIICASQPPDETRDDL